MVVIRTQCAALPYRFIGLQGLQVLLVTSRGSGRWILPKGWRIFGRTLSYSAGREAFEEAGVLGTVSKAPVGTYAYDKRVNAVGLVPFEVVVFALRVEQELQRWPEQSERTRQWFSRAEAAALVQEPTLKSLLGNPGLPGRLSDFDVSAESQVRFGRR